MIIKKIQQQYTQDQYYSKEIKSIQINKILKCVEAGSK